MTSIEISEVLKGNFTGELLTLGDVGYDEARTIHNGMIDKHPGLIARCLSTADVVDAVNLARESGAELSVRGGGHNVAGRAVTDGGLMIDLSPMRGIHVDPAGRTIRAQPGLTWRQFDRAAALFGLATTGGQVSSTGIAGLTLGGGLGWLMGRYGLTVDNLLSAEVVLASGDVVTASEDEHEDLFWALRGGGGNFGVVTSFRYRAHRVPDVVGGILAHPLSASVDVVEFYRNLTAAASDELGVACGFVHAPDGSGQKIIALPLCHCGDDQAEAEAELKPIRQFGPPIVDAVGAIPYPIVNTLLDGGFPKGTHSYWKSAFLTDLDSEVITTLTEAYEQVPSAMSAIVIEYIHGAATRVEPTATAFPHRQRGYNVLIIAQWSDPTDTQSNIAWARQTFEALRPHLASDRYVNYMSADDASFVRQAYGPNWDRLVQLKQRFDPTNLFRLNQNIDPKQPSG